MNGQIQIIERNGEPEWAVLPYETYLQLVDDAEMLQDIRDFDAVTAAIAQGDEELVPAEMAFMILDGDSPIKVWREYRGLTQHRLAEIVGISTPYLSQIESRKRTGSMETLLAIARALNLSLDDIILP